MMDKKVVAIAKSENVYLFRSLGFEVFLVDDNTNLKDLFMNLARVAQIIFIDELLQPQINDYRESLNDKAFPIVIALPIDGKATGQGLDKLRLDVEKAIGLRLF